MLGYIEFEETGMTDRMGKEQRFGGTFLVLRLGRKARGTWGVRRIHKAARKMRSEGVRRAVFPADFPYTSIFLRHGILPVDPLPLRCALAAAFVQKRLDALGISRQRAVIAVSGEYVSAELAETVRSLAMRYRYVLLSVRSGGEELTQKLRRQYGTALLTAPSADQITRADAVILFAPREELELKNPVLCMLYPCACERGRVPLRVEESVLEGAVPNCSQEQLAAALYSMGILAPERFLGEITC